MKKLLPKIFHIETGPNMYGGAKQVYYLIEGLLSKGYGENILICSKNSDISRNCKNMCRVYEIPMHGDLDASFLFSLIKLIKKEKPDIVHIHSRRGADIWGPLAAKITHTKSIITRRVDNPEIRCLLKMKYMFPDKVVAISNAIKDILIEQGILKDIQVIPSAVDVEFYNRKCEINWFLREFSLNKEVKKVGMVAQFIPRKGHLFLLKAIPFILDQIKDVVFLLFGKGGLLSQVKEEINKMRLGSHVKIIGFREDMERIYPCLDLLVHPASMEGLGVSLMQACAARVPVVATGVGGIPEVIRDGDNGFLVPVGDMDMFVKKVLILLNEPQLRKKMGMKGLEIVKKHFSVESMVNSYISLYSSIVNLGGPLPTA